MFIKETLTQLALSNYTKQEGEEEGQVCGWMQFALKCTVLIKKKGGGGVKRIHYLHLCSFTVTSKMDIKMKQII